jgi:hypothetical protein
MASFEFLAIVISILGLTASITYYAIILNNANKTQQQQLETRQAQLFMQIYGKWNEASFSKHYTYLIYGLKWSNYQEFKELILDNIENWESMANVIRFFEGLGVLLSEGLVDMRLIALTMATDIITYWEKLKPSILEFRRESNSPRIADQSEYLYNELLKYMKEHPKLAP